jgi:hypothetical protein
LVFCLTESNGFVPKIEDGADIGYSIANNRDMIHLERLGPETKGVYLLDGLTQESPKRPFTDSNSFAELKPKPSRKTNSTFSLSLM